MRHDRDVVSVTRPSSAHSTVCVCRVPQQVLSGWRPCQRQDAGVTHAVPPKPTSRRLRYQETRGRTTIEKPALPEPRGHGVSRFETQIAGRRAKRTKRIRLHVYAGHRLAVAEIKVSDDRGACSMDRIEAIRQAKDPPHAAFLPTRRGFLPFEQFHADGSEGMILSCRVVGMRAQKCQQRPVTSGNDYTSLFPLQSAKIRRQSQPIRYFLPVRRKSTVQASSTPCGNGSGEKTPPRWRSRSLNSQMRSRYGRRPRGRTTSEARSARPARGGCRRVDARPATAIERPQGGDQGL